MKRLLYFIILLLPACGRIHFQAPTARDTGFLVLGNHYCAYDASDSLPLGDKKDIAAPSQ